MIDELNLDFQSISTTLQLANNFKLPKTLVVALPYQLENVKKMSAYAASTTERKSLSKSKRARQSHSAKSKSTPLVEECISVTGFSIRRKVVRGFTFVFEAYLSLFVGVLVIVYVYGRRLVRWRSLSPYQGGRNPYSLTAYNVKPKSGSYKDLSHFEGPPSAEEENKVKPPQCLEDPAFGAHKFIKIQGVKLHYVEAGGGRGRPTLLLLHGAFDFWFTWRKLVPALARRFRVICLDLRGCGDSEKPLLRSSYSLDHLVEDVASFVRSVGNPVHDGVGGVSLVCAGWGGQVGWTVAQRHPGLVRKMVQIHAPHPHIMAGHYSSSFKTYYKLWPLLLTRLPAVPEWAAEEHNLGLVSKLLQPLVDSGDITDEELHAYYYNFSRTEDLTGAIHHARNWEPWRRHGSNTAPPILSTPTLLLMGDSDSQLPLEMGYKSAEYVERIKTRVLVGASNWAPVTHSTTILEEMATFFNEPRILDSRYASSDDDWDDSQLGDNSASPENLDVKGSIVGRMMGAGLSVVSRWNGQGKKGEPTHSDHS